MTQRAHTAQLRRLWHHVSNGGAVAAPDLARVVESSEAQDLFVDDLMGELRAAAAELEQQARTLGNESMAARARRAVEAARRCRNLLELWR